MYKTIFSIAFFIFSALAVLIGVLRGRKFRWQLSASKIIFTVAATVIAMLASMLIGLGLGSILSDILADYLIESYPTLSELENLGDITTALAASLIAPILFYAIFPIVRALSGGMALDLAHLLMRLDGDAADAEIEKRLDAAERGVDESDYLLRKLQRERKTKNRRRIRKKEMRYNERNILGATIGGIFAFVLFCIYLMPATGMLTVANDVVPFLCDTAMIEADETLPEIIDGAANNAGAVTVRSLGGKALYSSMTTYSVDGKLAKLETETKFISKFNDSFIASTLPAPEDETDGARKARIDKEAQTLRESVQYFEDAKMIPALFSKILPSAVSEWESGEIYMIPKPAVADDLMYLLKYVKNTTAETVKDDYATFVNIYALVLENDIVSDADIMETYANEAFTLGLMSELYKNERFVGAANSITSEQISLVFDRIDAPKDLDGAFTDFINGLFAALKESSKQPDRAAYLKSQNSYVFDSVSLKVTSTALDTFVAQELQQYSLNLPKKSEFKQFVQETPIDLLLHDGTVSHECISSQEQIEKHSYTVSFSAIKLSEQPVEDGDAEAQLLATAFKKMNEFVTLLKGGKAAEALKAAGPMLDALADSKTVGADNTRLFLIAILQSDDVHSETGISKIQSIAVADRIAKSGNYTEALEAIANGVSIMEAASSGRSTEATVRNLLSAINEETSEVLKLFFDEFTLQNYGTGRASSEKATEFIGHLFDNVTLAYERGMSPEKIAVEAAAISDFFEIIMNANESASSNLSFGDNCVTGLSATAHTSRVLSSEIVSQTLVDAVYAGKTTATLNLLSMNTTLTESEQDALLAALNSQWQSAAAQTDELAKTLISIASLSNCEVTLEGSEIVLVLPEVEEPEVEGEENI